MQSCVPSGKSIDYYSKTKHTLSYASSKPEMNILHEYSLKILWHHHPQHPFVTDYGLRRIFQWMIVNMVSVTVHLDQGGSNNEYLTKAWA